MPCDQIVHITNLFVRDLDALRKVADQVAKGLPNGRVTSGIGLYGRQSNLNLGIDTGLSSVQMNKSAAGALEFRGFGPQLNIVKDNVVAGYADALLIKALKKVDYFLVETTPMRPEVKKELGQDGVEHTFVSADGRQTVTIGRAANGRLHFEFGGYSQFEAQEVANLIVGAMNREGIQTEDLTIKQNKNDWLEEKLPDRESERE